MTGYLYERRNSQGVWEWWMTSPDDLQMTLVTAIAKATSVAGRPAIPARPRLLLGSNPVRPPFSVEYILEAPDEVAISLLDSSGRVVRRMDEGRQGIGFHSVIWDGHDGDGRKIPSGVYWLRASGLGGEATEKVVIVR